MTVTDDEVGTTDDMRRTLRDVRRVGRLLMQGLEPDDGSGPNLLRVLEEHLGVPPDTLAGRRSGRAP